MEHFNGPNQETYFAIELAIKAIPPFRVGDYFNHERFSLTGNFNDLIVKPLMDRSLSLKASTLFKCPFHEESNDSDFINGHTPIPVLEGLCYLKALTSDYRYHLKLDNEETNLFHFNLSETGINKWESIRVKKGTDGKLVLIAVNINDGHPKKAGAFFCTCCENLKN